VAKWERMLDGSKLVLEGKARFGRLSRTEANRLVVRKYLYDMCTEKGMRPSHIVSILDLAVDFVFIPTPSEVRNKQLLYSNVVQTLMHEDRKPISRELFNTVDMGYSG